MKIVTTGPTSASFSAGLVRHDTKFVGRVAPGTQLVAYGSLVLVVSPNAPPQYVTPEGTLAPLDLSPVPEDQ